MRQYLVKPQHHREDERDLKDKQQCDEPHAAEHNAEKSALTAAQQPHSASFVLLVHAFDLCMLARRTISSSMPFRSSYILRASAAMSKRMSLFSQSIIMPKHWHL